MGADATKSHQRLIVCDDDDLIRWAVIEHLTSEGFEVTPAVNGEQCLELALSSAPDAILTPGQSRHVSQIAPDWCAEVSRLVNDARSGVRINRR